MKLVLSVLPIVFLVLLLGACTKDNYKAPESVITGRIVYQGQPLGVRSPVASSGNVTSGVQLELWQKGYQLYTKVQVFVASDGSFSSKIFDGDYKLVVLKGTGPWADKLDSVDVHLQGTANVDIPVDPYFIIKNEAFTRTGTTINATFNIQKVNTTRNLDLVRLYIGQTAITDQNNNITYTDKAAAAITDITQPVTLSATVPAAYATKDYVYVRAAVKAAGITELLYTAPQKIMLK